MDVPADWPQRLRVVLMLCAATAAGGSAQTFTSLASFNITDGDNPFFAPLVQGTDGNLYGTAENGGTSNSCNGGCGTIFKITPMGVLTTLHSFDSTDGQYPQAGLVLATDGSMYGATELGGAHGDGVIFRVIDGKLSVLYNFCAQAGCLDGNGPNGLVQATNGDFYGTTVAGGATGDGTIYKITPAALCRPCIVSAARTAASPLER